MPSVGAHRRGAGGRRVAQRWPAARCRRAQDVADDTPSAPSASAGRSPSVPHAVAPHRLRLPAPAPPPPPPPLGSPGPVVAGAAAADPEDGRTAHQRRTEFIIVPRSAELHAAEDALGLALVAVVGGTRPPVSPAMVA